MKYCSKCGKEIADDTVFCASCGNSVIVANEAQAETSLHTKKKSKGLPKAIGIIMIVLGGIGVLFFGLAVIASLSDSDMSVIVECILMLAGMAIILVAGIASLKKNATKKSVLMGLAGLIIVVVGIIVLGIAPQEPVSETQTQTQTQTLAYSCADDLVEEIMSFAKNPHSMEIYTVTYDYDESNLSSETMSIYIYMEYALANDIGGLKESHGVAEYVIVNGEWSRSFKFLSDIVQASLGNGTPIISGRGDADWEKLDIDIIKTKAGLN